MSNKIELDEDWDTFPKLLVRNYQRWPDLIAMRKKDFGIWKEYNWKECYENVKDFVLGLIALGVQRHDKVAIIGENEPQWYWAEFAVQAAGAIVVGIYTDMVPSEVKYIVEHSEASYAIANDQEQVDKFLEIEEESPKLKKVIYWDDKGLKTYDDPLLISFKEVMGLGKQYEVSNPGVFEDIVAKGAGEDIAALYYTSGTTGLPKGAMITHRALINTGKAFLEYNPASNKESFFLTCLLHGSEKGDL